MRTTSREDLQVREYERGPKIIATSPLVVERLQKNIVSLIYQQALLNGKYFPIKYFKLLSLRTVLKMLFRKT